MEKDPTRDLETMNLKNLTIGVFAIVMTLLVLDIKAPDVAINELPTALLALWPNLLSYAISFALLGIYFMGYIAQFRYMTKSDHNSHWISFLFLALVTLIPFSTALLSKNPYSTLPIIIYSTNLAFIGLVLYWHWMHAIGNGLIGDLPPSLIKYAKFRCLVPPAGYLVAITVAFINPMVSLLICAVLPLLYIIPGMQKLFWMRLAGD